MYFEERAMQSNIETIYQQHLKPLSHDEQLKLSTIMAEESANGKERKEPVKKRSLLGIRRFRHGNPGRN
jgi:hypothetical protein